MCAMVSIKFSCNMQVQDSSAGCTLAAIRIAIGRQNSCWKERLFREERYFVRHFSDLEKEADQDDGFSEFFIIIISSWSTKSGTIVRRAISAGLYRKTS